MRNKSRKNKRIEYDTKYKDIPVDYNKRLEYMYYKYNINERKEVQIMNKYYSMLHSMYYNQYNIILYEEPEGSHRPRFNRINRSNLIQSAKNNPNYIHIYTPLAKEDNIYMKRLIEDDELYQLDKIIHTPCIVEYNAYIKTPSSYNTTDKILAEIGLIRPISKPDWDNIGKKYCDMYNNNIWVDDSIVISGTVNKYYSELPRVEINLKFLNTLYNKQQYNSMCSRVNNVDYIF